MSNEQPILEVKNLKRYFDQGGSILDRIFGDVPTVKAVDDVSLELHENEVKGIIGESGCGKTTLLQTLIGLEDSTAGNIRFKGQDIAEFSRSDWKQFRKDIQIVFQDPFNSLDPKMTVQESMLEPLKIHGFSEKDERVREALRQAELNPPEQYLYKLPEQLSGGEKQRVSIARALVVDPEVILADEPVSMLDVSTQAAILRLLSRLTEETGTSMLYISHDLSTVSYICNEINVMYLGRLVEIAPTNELLEDPKHPYSQALINAIPVPDPHHDRERTKMEASPPDPIDIGEGCRFRDRCPERMDVCEKTPRMVSLSDESPGNRKANERFAACHLYYDHESVQSDRTDGAEPAPVEKARGGDLD